MKSKHYVFTGIILFILIMFIFFWSRPIKKGVIYYQTNFSDNSLLKLKNDNNIDLKIEDVKRIVNGKTVLIFNENISKWYKSEQINFDSTAEERLRNFKRTESYVYHDYRLEEVIEIKKIIKQVVYKFLSTKKSKIEHTGKIIRILGLECEEVIFSDELGTPIRKVYYTSKIPYPIGPEKYLGLEGAILKVEDMLNNEILYEAISIESKKLDEVFFDRPKLKNMLDENEFRKLVEKTY